jgi:hypothetical protein
MTTPQAILAGAALIALAIVTTNPPSITAEAQVEEENAAPAAGLYQIATQANSGNVWQVDTRTGELRLCQPPRDVSGPPRCFVTGSPW